VRAQIDRGFYEFMYGLDVLLRERERMDGRTLGQADRRRSLRLRYELALAADPFVACEAHAAGLDLVVRSPLLPQEPVALRILDLP